MTTIGYIRVSSSKQTLEHQRFEIENFALKEGIKIDTWIEEKISSRKALDKRKLGALLNNLQENDILITCEISRLGRSLLEVMKILETCLNKNCQVWTIKENYRLGNDIQSKVLAFAFGLAAEIERNLISQRTKSSLANIKATGKKLGRPFNAETKKLKLAKNQKRIQTLLAKGVSKSQIARIFNVERATLRKYLLRLSALGSQKAIQLPQTGEFPFCLQLITKTKFGCHDAIYGKTGDIQQFYLNIKFNVGHKNMYNSMTNTINETINPREAVLFSCGGVNEVARQFAEMLTYCKRKNLHVVDVFFETSGIKSYEKDCMNKLFDYLKRNRTKQAVVFHSRKTYLKYVDINKLLPFMQSGQIELRFARDNVII